MDKAQAEQSQLPRSQAEVAGMETSPRGREGQNGRTAEELICFHAAHNTMPMPCSPMP